MSSEDWRVLRRHMRMPAFSFVVLMGLLAINVTLGATLPFRGVYLVEGGVLLCMVLTVLLVSMEVIHEPPLVRVFSGVGFFWVFLLFVMTLVDYLSR